ncbi:two-component system sensor histidine kinase CreC [Salmonella enterica subsp. enterica serovar Typhi]|uniref:histidine kinase n=1 Tax=Salmonella enterica subsp. enterica serovar Typhi str. 404ty TaxID=497977 RepID=A0A720EU57_SALTI|nr:two-component system sensor histidine kinase CreC [Salmonella enterica subsp. enterica serovar Typhi]HAD7179848.1 two-component system sensor histidine kinase CreC [Salmonella enterica subsp. enterica serovar Typhi str. 404ty]NRI75896.1 two-component system sensor histidine kinase CreC [Salmonella enterica subsp. enterica serovar Typhi]HAD7277861.1 two-component system sensor histidine kinase CreC [Salmonella enterica subsp. enterica serovar Typhi str. 404ty]HAD7407694.1 two-component system
MRIGMRLLLGYFLIVAVAAVFVLSIFVQEIKPGVRRATEGTLIDTATLLAALARDDLLSGNPTDGQLAKAFAQLQHRPFRANISGIVKVRNEYHVYMTDAQGKVLFDSENKAVGQDYSRWNDVWLTLRGQYGARSTAKDSADPNSTVMYVAAPIISDGRIIGVLTVGKPNAAMAPVIKRSERRILWASAVLLGIALAIGAGMVWWINRSIARLTRYADSVTENRPLALPALGSSELRKLAQALGNVLDNAIDFTPENGVITLSAQPMGEKAILQVTDSGCGIPDFALPRIFDRFYSLPRENGRKSSGLGLAFVSEAARLLNGEVTLCNRPEGGVLASLTLHRHFT